MWIYGIFLILKLKSGKYFGPKFSKILKILKTKILVNLNLKFKYLSLKDTITFGVGA